MSSRCIGPVGNSASVSAPSEWRWGASPAPSRCSLDVLLSVEDAVAGLLPPGTPVRLSVALEPEAEGTIAVVAMFFRSWSGADENAPTALARSAGGDSADAAPDGQDLDVPTYLRLGLRIDPA